MFVDSLEQFWRRASSCYELISLLVLGLCLSFIFHLTISRKFSSIYLFIYMYLFFPPGDHLTRSTSCSTWDSASVRQVWAICLFVYKTNSSAVCQTLVCLCWAQICFVGHVYWEVRSIMLRAQDEQRRRNPKPPSSYIWRWSCWKPWVGKKFVCFSMFNAATSRSFYLMLRESVWL